MSGEVQELAPDQARRLTDRIKVAIEGTWQLIQEAYLTQAWAALGYATWDEYCTREFGTSRLRLPREERQEVVGSLRDAGLSTRAIAAATGLGQTQVRRDLATEPNGSVTQVTGMNGKTYVPTQPPRPARESFICDDCGEAFGAKVWHCECCSGHWAESDADCKNCISLGCPKCLGTDSPASDADLLAGRIWVPPSPPAPTPAFQPAPRPMPAPPVLTPKEREERIRLVAKQEYLNAYSGAVDGLIALESYAASGCTPPAEIPDNYPALHVVVGRIAAVLSTWKNWNTAR